jgi:hypothetical protein
MPDESGCRKIMDSPGRFSGHLKVKRIDRVRAILNTLRIDQPMIEFCADAFLRICTPFYAALCIIVGKYKLT